MKILDCTFRDGGYYTNWDFPNDVKEAYWSCMDRLPVDYIEVGYRNKPTSQYQGEFFYTPLATLTEIRSKCRKKIVLILDEKEMDPELVVKLISPVKEYVDMIRFAVAPDRLENVFTLADALSEFELEICLNVMYMSKWENTPGFYDKLSQIPKSIDYLYLVDSFGSVFPNDVSRIISQVRQRTDVKLGFHGHNNLELALANSLTAIALGVELIDATILGMGRGAGNLKTELLLTVLNSNNHLAVDFDQLGKIVQAFEGLMSQHGWGTNLPYMLSGANSLPQKEVMEWVSRRFYSFNSIVRALENKKEGRDDNERLEVFQPKSADSIAIIIGGGSTPKEHGIAVLSAIEKLKGSVLIHASSKNASFFKDLSNHQYFCLVGNEGHRLENVFENWADFKGTCLLPPYPRKMGTYIPQKIKSRAFELNEITFTDKLLDSHTVLALQTALELQVKEIYLIGYDGYHSDTITTLEKTLMEENNFTFEKFEQYTGIRLHALTPTAYDVLTPNSLYSIL
jgi:4-hydroxy 2-oxovalerate aldolase